MLGVYGGMLSVSFCVFSHVPGNKLWHLAPDQAASAKSKDARGNRWSDATVQKALQMRLACGSRGYDFLREEALPLPSERTLQRRIEDIKFEPGIYTVFSVKMSSFKA